MLSIRAPFAWLGPGRTVPDVQIDCDGDTVTYVGRDHPVPEHAELIVTTGFLMPAATSPGPPTASSAWPRPRRPPASTGR